MSVFRTQKLACPSCQGPVEFQTVISINADRRADLRAAILDGSFQRESCPNCGRAFRLEPEMVYFDLGRRQWLLVRPVGARHDWPALETQARNLFAAAFGNNTPAGMREQIQSIHPRVTFGWAALREKILCVEHGLDDATLELLKVSTIRGLDNTPLTDETELRLVNVEGEELVLAWIRSVPEEVAETLRIPRALYDEIAADTEGWKSLRSELESALFVDVYRLLLSEAEPTAPPASAPEPAAAEPKKDSDQKPKSKPAAATKPASKKPEARKSKPPERKKR